jgi:hypothetical protein
MYWVLLVLFVMTKDELITIIANSKVLRMFFCDLAEMLAVVICE